MSQVGAGDDSKGASDYQVRIMKDELRSDTPKSAFPVYAKDDGMTLRDYFAAKIMAALIMEKIPSIDTWQQIVAITAVQSYDAADAMMEEREKRQ